MITIRTLSTRGGVSLIAIVFSTSVHAQTNVPRAKIEASAEAGSAASDAAGEIVVTANKREQNLSKVGLSVTAFGAAALATQRISNVADLAQATPGLTFAPSPTSAPVYTLRGVGFFESTLAAYPDVSLYLDQVPLSLPVMSTLTAFDLERVEVLKGPQGTLFGNNATGGAINFIASKPTDQLHSGGELSYGRFNTVEAQGYVSGPITDTLRARLAFRAQKGDEWQRSYTRDDKLGKLDNVAGRLLLDWSPTDRLKFSLNVNGWRDRNDPIAPQKLANSPQFIVTPTIPLLAYPFAPGNARAADWGPDHRPFANNRFKQATLRGDYDLGNVTLSSLTGYSDLKFLNATESDGTSLAGNDFVHDQAHIKSFTQELRLANGSAERFRWVVGANYERTTVYEEAEAFFYDTTTAAVNGFGTTNSFSDQRMRNYAAFANAEFDLVSQLTLKVGVRQTKAERNYVAANHDSPDFPPPINPFTGAPLLTLTQFFNAAYTAIYGGRVPLIQPFGSIVLDTRTNPDGSPVDPSTYLTAADVRNKLSESSTSWSVGINYKPSDNLLFYLNASKGFKAGSFPQLSGSLFTAYGPVKQESLIDYEVGFKTQLLDRRLSINAAAFYYDYSDKQLRGKFVDPLFGALDKLINVPKSRVTGAEVDVQARPARGLTISAAGTYLDATVREYDGVVGTMPDPVNPMLRAAKIASFKGVRLPFSPKLQYTLRADYDRPLTGYINGFFGVGINGQVKSIGILTTSQADRQTYKIDGRAIVNLNVGVRSSDGRWKFTVWGKNVLNKYYWTNTILAYDTVSRYAGRPAEYGASIGFQF